MLNKFVESKTTAVSVGIKSALLKDEYLFCTCEFDPQSLDLL